MKKLALTIAIVLGLSLGTYAQNAGLFGYGETPKEEQEENPNVAWYGFYQNEEVDEGLFGLIKAGGDNPGLPGHNQNTNQNAPLGSGALLLIGFGAAYALKKRNQK